MPATDLPLLIEAAEAAGHIAARYWQADPETWDKPGHQGPVSEADYAIDTMLRDTLLAARPNYGWLSEETEDGPARLGREHVFIVDPLDGTRAFLNGDRSFAHALAVAERGQITAAVVFLPLRDKMYSATRGGGAHLNGVQLRASGRHDLTGANVLTAKPALDPEHWRADVPEIRRSLRPSLAYRLCLVAEGRYDAMITLRDSWHWDIAAGDLICAEAGAQVTDRKGQPMRYNASTPRAAGVIAANPALNAAILGQLA